MAEELRLDAVVVDKFSRPLQDLRKRLQDVKPGSGVKDLKREFDDLHGRVQKVAMTLTGPMRSALTGLGVSGIAAGAGIAGIAAGLKAFAGNVTELKALNQETGVSIENFRRLRAAAPFFGMQSGEIDAGIRKFREKMHDFAKQKGPFGDLFVFAPGMAKAIQKALNSGDINKALDVAIDGVAQERQRDPTNAARIARLLGIDNFDKFGSRGLDTLKRVLREAAANQKPWSKGDVKSAEEFEDSINRLQNAFGNLGDTIAKNLAPALTPVMEQFGKWVEMNKGAIGAGIRDSIEYLKTVDWKQIGDNLATVGHAFMLIARGVVNTVDALKGAPGAPGSVPRGPLRDQVLNAQEAMRLPGLRKQLEEIDKRLADDPDGKRYPAGGVMRQNREALANEIRKLEEATRSGTKDGVKDGLKEMYQLQNYTPGGSGFGNLLQRASYGGAAVAFGGGGTRLSSGAGGLRVPGGGARDSGTVFNDGNAFFDAIIKAEGTARHGDPYNTSLGYLKSPKPLTSMTMDESLKWGEVVRRKMGLNSSAKGAFQIVNTTQRKAMAALGLTGDDLFNEENQRKMASWIAHHQGLGAWEGFKAHPSQRARAYAAMGRGEDRRTASMPLDWPKDWKVRSESGTAAAGASAWGGPSDVGGKGRLDMYVHGMPNNWRMRSETGGLFREFNISRGRNMTASSEEN